MAINSLSPAFIKIIYFRGVVQHTMVIPTKFGGALTPGSAPFLETHASGVQVAFATAMAAWNDLLEPMFGTNTTFVSAEAWSQPTPADNPIWLYTYGMAGVGTNPTQSIPAQQQVYTFRTDQGGLYRLYLMESSEAVNQRVSYAGMGNPGLALANFVTGQTSWIYGRDGGEVIHCLQLKTKTNDVLRRRLLTG